MKFISDMILKGSGSDLISDKHILKDNYKEVDINFSCNTVL